MSLFTDEKVTNEFNVAVVDSLITLAHHLNSGIIAAKVYFKKEYEVAGEILSISCHGGCKEGKVFFTMSLSEDGQVISEMNIDLSSDINVDGGFGEMIKENLNRLLGKEKTVPDYVVESLNKGYAGVKCSEPKES